MISIGTTFNYDIPLREQVFMIEKAGFTHISLGGGNVEHSGYLTAMGQKSIRKVTRETGLEICSIHAPFKGDADISSSDRKTAGHTLDLFKKCIDATVNLRAKTLIFHPSPDNIDDIDYRKKILVEQVYKLLEYIGNQNLQLAVENLRSVLASKVLSFSLDKIANSKYGLCYDSSHDNLVRNPLAILKRYGKQLITTHIADNAGVNDDHILPFEGSFPWDKFCEILSETGFSGIFLLEVEMRNSAFKVPEEFLKEAFVQGQKLIMRIRHHQKDSR